MRDVEALAEGLRRHLARGDRVTGVEVLSAGHSNETYRVRGLDCILRMPPSSAPLLPKGLDVARQFDLYAVLRGRSGALPVPGLELMCDDTSVLGAPFFLMECVDGVAWSDWSAPDWARDGGQDFQENVSRQALDAVVALHRMAPLEVLGPVLGNDGELQRWRQLGRTSDMAELDRLFDRLEKALPPVIDPAPNHGDPKLPNMLWRGGVLGAVLDWELAFNGDPRWDLAYMLIQPTLDLPGLWQRERIVAEWRAATGRKTDDLVWFEAAVLAKIGAILRYGHQLFVDGRSSDERFAQWHEPALHYTRSGHAVLDRCTA